MNIPRYTLTIPTHLILTHHWPSQKERPNRRKSSKKKEAKRKKMRPIRQSRRPKRRTQKEPSLLKIEVEPRSSILHLCDCQRTVHCIYTVISPIPSGLMGCTILSKQMHCLLCLHMELNYMYLLSCSMLALYFWTTCTSSLALLFSLLNHLLCTPNIF